MRRGFPLRRWAISLIACTLLTVPPTAASGDLTPLNFSNPAFKLTVFGKNHEPVYEGQGVVVGSRGEAIVSISGLEGATSAIATTMDDRALPARWVLAADDVAGLLKVRLGGNVPIPEKRHFESHALRAGQPILFISQRDPMEQTLVQCTLTSVRLMVEGFEGIHYLETSLSLPPPGSGIYTVDGCLLGLMVMRFGSGQTGLLVSSQRLENLADERGPKVSIKRWSNRRTEKWDNTITTRLMMARVALWRGRPDTAVYQLEDHIDEISEHQAGVAALLGEAYLALDLLPESIIALKTAIQRGSTDDSVYRNLAWAYMKTGQSVQAEELCYRALQRNPAAPSGYNLLAHFRNLQGKYQEAVYEAHRSLQVDPDCPCAYFEMGRGYMGLGRYDLAIEALKRATTLDPEYGEAFNSLGYSYLRHGKPFNAIVVLREAVKLEPEMQNAWDNLGRAYSSVDLSSKAVRALRQALCLDPSISHTYCRLARELLRADRYGEAEAILQKGLTRCEETQWVVYYLGKTYWLDGRNDLAREFVGRLSIQNSNLADQLLRMINPAPGNPDIL